MQEMDLLNFKLLQTYLLKRKYGQKSDISKNMKLCSGLRAEL